MARTFGLFIFGDEILSGKRQDRHFEQVKSILAARGLALSWVHYLGDDRMRCVRAFRESFASGDVVFSCGGIGSTPDDPIEFAVRRNVIYRPYKTVKIIV